MYEIRRLIGRGCYSLVYEVKREEMRANCSKLAFKRTFFLCASAVRCALRERQIFRRLHENHIKSPFLPTLYHSFRIGQSCVLVMNLTSGNSLADILYQYLPLSEQIARFYIAEVMCALEKLHQLEIVHMDIRPDNILIHHSGHIVLADFDRSYDVSFDRNWPKLKQYGGDCKFMAPEVANRMAITTRADVWGLGLLAATLVSGNVRPHKDQSMLFEIAKRGMYRIPKSTKLSKYLLHFIEDCLIRDFTKRPEVYVLKHSFFFDSLDWEVVSCGALQPPIKPLEVTRFADFYVNSRDPSVLSAALEESFPNLTYSLENPHEKAYLLNVDRYDPDDLQREGFTDSGLEGLFADYDFMDSAFIKRILVEELMQSVAEDSPGRKRRRTSREVPTD